MAKLEMHPVPPERSIPITWGMPRPSITIDNPALVSVSLVPAPTATSGSISPDLYRSLSQSLNNNGQKNLVVLFTSRQNPSQQIVATYTVPAIDPQLTVGATYLFSIDSLFPNGVGGDGEDVVKGIVVYLDWDTSGPRGSRSFVDSSGEEVGGTK